MEGLVTLITLAVLLEAAVEWFKDVVYVKDYTKYIALVGGIAICYLTGIGFLQALGIPVMIVDLDYLLSGLIIARGSNMVHDLIDRLNK